MKRLLTLLALTIGPAAFAQNSSHTVPGGCGTITPQRELDKIYDFVQHNPAAYRRGTAVQDSIPLSIHIVGKDDGEGYYPLYTLFRVLCQLNDRYQPVGVHFYIQWPIHYINNSAYYQQDYTSGEDMMIQNNEPDAANVYFVQDPAGNCGYYSYYGDAVSIGKNCAGTGSTTLTHELGHYFSLPHTFSGWEYGTPPDPENVTRSGPGANCNSAGDGFCDTYADYYAQRWACPGPVGKLDANGDLYHLDSSMYMSYSLDACQSRFSDQQIAAMQYNILYTRNFFAGATIPAPHALDTPVMMYPADTLFSNLKKLVWNRVPGADYYLVRILLQSSPSYVVETDFVSDTSVTITKTLVDGGKYIANIIPVNAHDFCMDKAVSHFFTNADRAGQVGIAMLPAKGKDMVVYPNPLPRNGRLNVQLTGVEAGDYNLSVLAVNGQVLAARQLHYAGNQAALTLPLQALPSGLYFIRCTGPQTAVVARLRVE